MNHHPTKTEGGTIKRLTIIGATIYGTDKYGTIIITTDGKTYQVLTEHGAENMSVAATALPSPTSILTEATPSSWQLAGLQYDPMGRDRNCSAFTTHAQAQAFFIAAGGPEYDRHRLDGDNDGIACVNLP